MPHHVETDIAVQRFGFTGDETGKKLHFPHTKMDKVEGRAGNATYGATDAAFEDLVGRLDTLRWTAGAASMGSAYLRDDAN
ncbi:MAG: hypothetical protein H0T79_17150, partial [Deltaproteobacteria bacterium]|nr:hypothetical protein [Deltaproteobacteria bacterium]